MVSTHDKTVTFINHHTHTHTHICIHFVNPLQPQKWLLDMKQVIH